jgi:hypothetical protein
LLSFSHIGDASFDSLERTDEELAYDEQTHDEQTM